MRKTRKEDDSEPCPRSPNADRDPELPNQAPKVQQSVRQGSLGCNVGMTSIGALGKAHSPFINKILKPTLPTPKPPLPWSLA